MTAQAERASAVDILIAEDDAPTRRSLRALLEQQGYTCAEAGDGRRALELALSAPPRCVLLDLVLPGLDGFAVARRLRADPRTSGVHIYCLSGLSDPAAREQARQAGCEAFLSKPVEPTQLLETVLGPEKQPGVGVLHLPRQEGGVTVPPVPPELPPPEPGRSGDPGDSGLTESGWLACAEPEPMVEFVIGTWKYTLSELACWLGLRRPGGTGRKLRLFACACLRRVWDRIDDPLLRQVVEVNERYADGLASRKDFLRAHAAPGQAWDPWGWRAAEDAAYHAADLMARFWLGPHPAGARREQAALLRDIFGNPFRPVTVNPAWLTWKGGAIPKLAQSIYDQRALSAGTLDPARLAVLADALEVAGCTEAALLDHLREPGPHVRGCWVIDLLRPDHR
jgi:CheY-like chemotaxis protein